MPATTTKKSTRQKPRDKSPYSPRVKQLRAALDQAKLASLLVMNPADIRYLTGFHGDDSTALVTMGQLFIISDFRFQEELGALGSGIKVVIRSGDMIGAIQQLVEEIKPFSVGIQSEHCSVAQRRRIAKVIGAKRVRNTVDLLTDLRIIKDDHEVRLIRKAVRIQQESLEAVLTELRPGDQEQEIAARLLHEMQCRGARKSSFDVIAAARANGSLPHAIPGRTTIGPGKPLLIDWGALVDGYCSDMTRTFCFGRWPAPLREIYEIVLEAHLAAIEAVKPGVACADVDAAARVIIEQAGYGEYFGHGTGHGIGLNIHEAPRLARTATGTLKPGMVVTIEPGIYLPGIGGVRIEDDILVTERGRRNLCSMPKDIDWATR